MNPTLLHICYTKNIISKQNVPTNKKPQNRKTNSFILTLFKKPVAFICEYHSQYTRTMRESSDYRHVTSYMVIFKIIGLNKAPRCRQQPFFLSSRHANSIITFFVFTSTARRQLKVNNFIIVIHYHVSD